MMILCALSDFPRYAGLHPRFAAVAAFLASADLADLPEGRTDLEGFAALASRAARTRPRAEALLEAHRAHIDVQVVLEGAEAMGWAPLAACREVATLHDAEKDIAFFRDAPASLLAVPPGHLAVFFPEDAHAPLVGDGGAVHKVVIKVPTAG